MRQMDVVGRLFAYAAMLPVMPLPLRIDLTRRKIKSRPKSANRMTGKRRVSQSLLGKQVGQILRRRTFHPGEGKGSVQLVAVATLVVAALQAAGGVVGDGRSAAEPKEESDDGEDELGDQAGSNRGGSNQEDDNVADAEQESPDRGEQQEADADGGHGIGKLSALLHGTPRHM